MSKGTEKSGAAKTAKPMTGRRYAKQGGNVCPFCRSRNVKVSGAIMPDDRDGATLDVDCSDCNRSWRNVYRLVGYDAYEGNEGNEPTEAEPDEED